MRRSTQQLVRKGIVLQMDGNSPILPRRKDLESALLPPSSWSLYKLDDESRGNLTQERFDRLLEWLSRDRDEAGRIYENIRSALIAGFRSQNCSLPDKLADKTIDRVARKLGEMVQPYVGDPLPYFYRVAYYVRWEDWKTEGVLEELPADLEILAVDEDIEPEFDCLEQCLAVLSTRNRDLILRYYQGEKRTKIELREQLAATLNITLPVLRLRAQRIRNSLKKCIKACLLAKSRLDGSIPNLTSTGSIVELESEA